MAQRLTDKLVKGLPAPGKGAKVYYDEGGGGFGVRVTAKGARSFVLDYRTKEARNRRYTIGGFPNWKVGAARDRAKELKRRIDRGDDPQEELNEARTAPTVNDLIEKYCVEHLSTKRPGSQREDRDMLRLYIKPTLGSRKVNEVTHDHVGALHRKITGEGKPFRANRVVALLSTMFNLALVRWNMRDRAEGNPCQGIVKNPEEGRERFLSPEEIARLMKALSGLEDKQAANVIMLALLTGARRGELLKATWDQFELPSCVWSKPSAHTKQKRVHRVVLSPEAVELLMTIREADPKAVFVFPSARKPGTPRENVKLQWYRARKAAGLEDVRFHDLRHSYASLLISNGVSLPIIGRLLGHTQAQTTMRYAHLADHPFREATNRVGKIVGRLA